jgi:hypothetical protein
MNHAFVPCWCCGSDTICACRGEWGRCPDCGKCSTHQPPTCPRVVWDRAHAHLSIQEWFRLRAAAFPRPQPER